MKSHDTACLNLLHINAYIIIKFSAYIIIKWKLNDNVCMAEDCPVKWLQALGDNYDIKVH